MRTWRWLMMVTVIASLLAALPTTTVAQSDPEDAVITAITGTLVSSSFDDSDEQYQVDADGVGHARGARLTETYTYSDPRLPAEKRLLLNFDVYPLTGGASIWVLRTTIRIDGPDGYWAGTGQWFGPVEGTAASGDVYAGGQDVLFGHGAYDGLMLTLGCDAQTGCSGYIIEGAMPPDPEPVPALES